MKKILLILSLFPSLAFGIINDTPEQVIRDPFAGGSNTETINATDGWATPTLGNILIAQVSIDNSSVAQTSYTAPSGFTILEERIAGAFYSGGYVACRISDGTETSFTTTLSQNVSDGNFVMYEMDATDLDADCSTAITNKDVTNANTATQSIPSGNATSTVADSLALAFFHNEGGNLWQTNQAYSNSFVEQYDSGEFHAGAGAALATRILNTTGSYGSTMSHTQTPAQRNWGAIIIFSKEEVLSSINDVPEQVVRDTFSYLGTSRTINSSDGWVSPTSGNILIAQLSIDATSTGQTSYTKPSGFAVLEEHIANPFYPGGYIACKISDGTETSFTAGTSQPVSDATFMMYEIDSTGLDANCDSAVTNLDTTNAYITGLEGPTGDATSVTPDSLALAFVQNEGGNVWKSTSWSNSFTERHDSAQYNQAGAWLATRVLTTVGSYGTTLTAAYGTNQRSWGVMVIFPSISSQGLFPQSVVVAGTSQTTALIGATEGWSAPASGNAILSFVALDALVTPQISITPPSGFTIVEEAIGGPYYPSLQVSCKISNGTETSLRASWDIIPQDYSFTLAEVPMDGYDANCANIVSNIDTANIASATTTLSTGSATNSLNSSLAIAIVGVESAVSWFDQRSWTNDFIVEVDGIGETYSQYVNAAATQVATKALTVSASQSSSFMTSSTGSRGIGAILIFEEKPAGNFGMDDTVPYPNQLVTYSAATNFAGNITTLTSPEGDTVAAEAGATINAASFIIWPLEEYAPAGDAENTRWANSGVWTVGDGTTTENVTMEITPVGDYFGQASCIAGTDCPGNSVFVAPLTSAGPDDYYCRFTITSGEVNSYGAWVMDPSVSESQIKCRTYDVSTTGWLAEGTLDINLAAPITETCTNTLEPVLDGSLNPSVGTVVPDPTCEE